MHTYSYFNGYIGFNGHVYAHLFQWVDIDNQVWTNPLNKHPHKVSVCESAVAVVQRRYHYRVNEPHPTNTTIIAQLYCKQLEWAHTAPETTEPGSTSVLTRWCSPARVEDHPAKPFGKMLTHSSQPCSIRLAPSKCEKLHAWKIVRRLWSCWCCP